MSYKRWLVQGWPDPERWLTIALHSVRLHPQHAQRHAHQRLFLMYSFLPGLCPAEEQCTHSLPATDTLLTFQHVQVCIPLQPFFLAHHLGFWIGRGSLSCTVNLERLFQTILDAHHAVCVLPAHALQC